MTGRSARILVAAVAGASSLSAEAGAGAASPYPIVPTSKAVLTGTFVMHGRITVAVGVRGERPGETITRAWAFFPQSCRTGSCQRVVLRRERSAGTHTTITLRRDASGTYRGAGAFDAPLRCLGRTYPRGETALYAVSVRIKQAIVVNDVRFAETITATYLNSRRIDHTICPLGPSHDAARYTGTLDLSSPYLL
jgi:hypothetical protein